MGDISDHTTYNLPSGPYPEDRAGRGELPTAHPGGARQPGGRTYGLLGVHPQAGQVITKEGDLVFGARCQGEVGAAGPRLQTHKTAGDKLPAQLDGPRLDGERRGSLITQVNRVGYIWKQRENRHEDGSAAPREMGTIRPNTYHGQGTLEIFLNMKTSQHHNNFKRNLKRNTVDHTSTTLIELLHFFKFILVLFLCRHIFTYLKVE